MKLPIQYTTFEERQKIHDLFNAEYYGFKVDRKTSSLVVTAYENDKRTVKGTYNVQTNFQFGVPLCPNQVLPREAFLLGVTICIVDGEPYYFLGTEVAHIALDDRQYFAVSPVNENTDDFKSRVNDIDNFITLLAPVMDAQALYQPADDDEIPAAE